MRHTLFTDSSTFKVAILIKESSFKVSDLNHYYMNYLTQNGVDANDCFATTLAYKNNKATATIIKEHLNSILPVLSSLGTQYIYCADSAYFKALTKAVKVAETIGYVLPCVLKGFEHFKVIYGLNYSSLMYNPAQAGTLTATLKTLAEQINTGTVAVIGQNVIHTENYPILPNDIKDTLEQLHQYPALVVDVETFSLKLKDCGLGTISFAWDEHNGIGFAVDYALADVIGTYHGKQTNNVLVKHILKEFLETYQGKFIAHSATFDFKVLVFNLWMTHPLDYVGMYKGIEVVTRLFDDTAIIAYLALNTTAEYSRSLKVLAHEYTGKYSQEDIKDIRKIPLNQLLKYNLIDCLATWYVYNKYYPIMVKDNQEDLYNTLMKDSLKLILQIELVGMPMDIDRIQAAKDGMLKIAYGHYESLRTSYWVHEAIKVIREDTAIKANQKLKKLIKTADDFKTLTFNPNSAEHTKTLLYRVMGLPVIDTTDSGAEAVGKDTLNKLMAHTRMPSQRKTIEALLGINSVAKILNSFIPAFMQGFQKTATHSYLHGNFVLGGTVSGRLSSNSPNMQNLPSGSDYGELIKSCFVAPKGWIMCYADYSSLEDRISALITKDPAKLGVYTSGYDGHCLRAYNYFPEAFVGVPNTVEGINGTAKTHAMWRQMSKAPTFALTYLGTYRTLMANCGFTEETARSIEANYHKLYKVSDDFIDAEIEQAANDGYLSVAFGLKIRTAIINRTVLGTRVTPYQAEAEKRTLGNAIGQSWGLLNNRSTCAFMDTVKASQYKHDILCISLIHDAAYFLIKDDIDVIKFVNDNLIKEMQWQDHPKIQHESVGLGGELDLCIDGWHQTVTVPNNSSREEIETLYNNAKEEFLK